MSEQWDDPEPDRFDDGEPIDPVGAIMWRVGHAVGAFLRLARRERWS